MPVITFECDEFYGRYYDRIMDIVDPHVDHAGWLKSVCSSYGTPKKVLDIGAGTGRVTKYMKSVFPHAKIIAVEPDTGLAEHLEPAGIFHLPMTIQQAVGDSALKDVDLAYVTYGSLQYVPAWSDLQQTITAVRNILASGGVCAAELYASEVYHADIEPGIFPLVIDEEEFSLSFSVERLPEHLICATTQITRSLDGRTGTMRETVLPVTVDQVQQLFYNAGFSAVEVTLNGAYHRCVGVVD